MSTEIADQADGFIAAFWNENGNSALCQVVFASFAQAQDWAVASLKANVFDRPSSSSSLPVSCAS